MALVSPNGLWLTRASVPSLSRSDGLIEAMATGKLSLASSGDNVVIGGQGNPDTITIGSNLTTIKGMLTIDGTLDVLYANDVVVTNLVVNVASGAGSNDASSLVDGAGILVADPHSSWTTDERSIAWRSGISSNFYGVSLTAQGSASNQGCWDVSGGALRITMPVPATSNAYPTNLNGGQQPGFAAGRDVSYGMRVNRHDEFELFKRVLPFSCNQNEAGASYRVIAKFGGAAGPNAITLPVSYNPWPKASS